MTGPLAGVDLSELSHEISDVVDDFIRYIIRRIKCIAGEVRECRMKKLDRRCHSVDWIARRTTTIEYSLKAGLNLDILVRFCSNRRAFWCHGSSDLECYLDNDE